MDIQKKIAEMTLEEKVAMLQGKTAWLTVGAERVGVPSVWVSDGPIGLRKESDEKDEQTGWSKNLPAVCFPAMVGLAASFDPDLAGETGATIADACQGEHVDVLLGPAANIKRSPLCGRNFEYVSEDPYLSGRIAAGHICGTQSKGVGTSLKHFAANSQETRRFCVNEVISERALREIYLASFETAVKEGKPWTVMCSYNKINGTYSSENKWLLTDVLRNDWGYDGLVMSDWGAVNDHAKSVEAGLSLQMPVGGPQYDAYLCREVREGRVSEEAVDREVYRVLQLTERCLNGRDPAPEYDAGQQHHMARKIAREAMVLLKNDGGLLPITGNKKVAFIGDFARKPRFQGGGSSHINATEILSALDAVRSVCPVTFAQGFDADADTMTDAQLKEAVSVAADAEIAVLFLGLPDAYETEGRDRTHMKMPAVQEKLLEEILKVRPQVIVVLHNGSPVEMPWIDRVPALLEAYLGGQAGGGAVVDLLFGAVSPCGKLAETFPLKLEDNPSYLNFPGDREEVRYAEDIYVGYRYYDKKGMEVLFPFGYGLTYTTFAYSNLRLGSDTFRPGEKLTATVTVTNTGKTAAKEIVQFYVRPDHPGKPRPVRELKGFGKILLQPGESGDVTVELDDRSFAYWEEQIHDWFVEPGKYVIEAAASSRDIRCTADVNAECRPLPFIVNGDTLVGDIVRIPGGREVLAEFAGGELFAVPAEWYESVPLHNVAAHKQTDIIDRGELQRLADRLNEIQK